MVTKRVIVLPKLQPEPAAEADPAVEVQPGAPLHEPVVDRAPQQARPPAAQPAPAGEIAAITHTASSFWPLLICSSAWLLWMGFHTVQLDLDRQALKNADAQLQPAMEKSAQVRQALDGLATDTQRLADGGNVNARLLVEELKRRGVTINPAAPAASAAK